MSVKAHAFLAVEWLQQLRSNINSLYTVSKTNVNKLGKAKLGFEDNEIKKLHLVGKNKL